MATGGDDLIFFDGLVGQLTTTIVNPYTGDSVSIDEQKNINRGVYDGLGGVDTILMTNFGDALFMRDSMGNQVVANVEVFLAGDGGDVIALADTSFFLGDTIIFGGQGDDILWANNGNDFISASTGHDIIDGGGGNDEIFGEDGDDRINGGDGNDTINAGSGNNIVSGGDGSDNLVYNGAGNVTVTEVADGDLDIITLGAGSTLGNLSFTDGIDSLTITVGALGSITITNQYSAAGSGLDEIVFNDGSRFNLRDLPHNYAPVANNDAFSGNEDTVITGNLLTNDTDPNSGDVLSVAAATFTTANGGSVVLLADGSMSYTPAVNYFGSDSFVYTLLDGHGGSGTATVNITINSVNDAPVAQDDFASGNEDAIISGSVLGNDNDVDGGVLSVVAATLTTVHNGFVTINSDGTYDYTPAADFFGTDSFDYTLLDGQGGSDTGTVNLTINSVNDAPVATDDDFSGDEDTAISGNVLGNDNDIDGGILSVVAATITTLHNGTVELLANGDFTYTPAADYYGTDSFDYTLLDGQGGNDTGTVNLTINAVDDAIVGTNGDDVLNGTGNDDEMSGLGGADNIMGNGGNDRINYFADGVWSGGFGALNVGSVSYDGTNAFVGIDGMNRTFDQFNGGAGVDTIVMTAGNDALFLDDSFSSRPTGTSGAHIVGIEVIDAGAGNDVVDLTSKSYDYGDVTIMGGAGNDHLWASAGNDTIHGDADNDDVFGGAGNDHLFGDDGNDVVMGGFGNDRLEGGQGNDTIYGGMNSGTITVDKHFVGDVLFPNVMETVNIHNLVPPGDPAVGIQNGNLDVGQSTSAVITRQASASGYNSTLGYYSIGEHGEMLATQTLWTNMNAVAVGATQTIDFAGDEIGFFIIANGNNTNNAYAGLNILGDNVLHFVYDYGMVTQRAATVNDAGGHISLVYDDGHTTRVLQGPIYYSTERGGDPSLNYDHNTHVISGLINANNTDVMRIGFEDLPGLGDADYQDVVFDINFNAVQVDGSEAGNDVLIGGAGNDNLYGEAGNDILVTGLGADHVYGGAGSDQIVYSDMDGMVDMIHGFETGAGKDALNLTDILQGYDAMDDVISDFVRLFNNVSGHTEVQVNADGDAGGVFTTVAAFDMIIADNIATLMANGNLVVDQHVNV